MVYTINDEQLTRRKLITIDGSQVTTQTGIPLMLNIDLPNVATDGKDVRLAKLDGTPIAREIECVDVPNTDSVTIHYPFDTVASTDSQFYVYWGNASLSEPAVDSTYGSEAVWDSNYVAVNLFNVEPNGSGTGDMVDSTSNGHDATANNFTANKLIDLGYGKAVDFPGSNEYYEMPDSADWNLSTMTFTFIVNPDTLTGYHCFIDHTADNSSENFITMNNANLQGYGGDANAIIKAAGLGIGTTSIITCKADGTDWEVFNDDTSKGTNTSSAVWTDTSTPVQIGERWDTNSGHIWQYDGKLIGMFISDIARSNNYLTTFYKNNNNPTASGTDQFYKSISTPQHQRKTPQFIN